MKNTTEPKTKKLSFEDLWHVGDFAKGVLLPMTEALLNKYGLVYRDDAHELAEDLYSIYSAIEELNELPAGEKAKIPAEVWDELKEIEKLADENQCFYVRILSM